MNDLSIVILAAGVGKRIQSKLPKVLHKLGGKPLLEHVISTASFLKSQPIVVHGHQGDLLQHQLAYLNVQWVKQEEQLGTGHAVLQALKFIPENHRVLILYGDVPLITSTTLNQFISTVSQNALGLLTANLQNPTGYGRIIRQKNEIIDIIEEKDANENQRTLKEINSGIYLVPPGKLHQWLPTLTSHNNQKEYYLTEIVKCAVKEKISIQSIQPAFNEEIAGVNDRMQLSTLERFYQRNRAEQLMQKGVTLADPNRLDIRGEVGVGKDVFIDVNVILEGRVVIGDDCTIGANCILRNVILKNHVIIHPNSIVDGAEIYQDSVIGPFARIRPGTEIKAFSHIGNFVEIKNSFIGEYTKINHLSYISDSEIGKRVNIGAGTITCNYDGVNKHRTIVEDDVFIGSNSQLVAPLKIGEGATIGAGSTITRDAPAYQLTICRALQRSIANWQKPKKEE